MPYLGQMDYNLEVLKGNVPNSSMVFLNGHDQALTTTRTTVHPTGTTANIDQSGLASSAATVDVASTDANDDDGDSGLRTLLLQGLDSSGNAQSETITMNGQTEVTSANTYSAITGMIGTSWGASAYNEGTVWCGNGTFTGGVPATKYFSMDANGNKALTAYIVVPTSQTYYMRQITLAVATSNKDVDFYLETSSNGLNWITQAVFGMEPFTWQGNIIAVPGLVAGTHVRVEAQSSASGTDVTAIVAFEAVTS